LPDAGAAEEAQNGGQKKGLLSHIRGAPHTRSSGVVEDLGTNPKPADSGISRQINVLSLPAGDIALIAIEDMPVDFVRRCIGCDDSTFSKYGISMREK
jgi:hypothetical protein